MSTVALSIQENNPTERYTTYSDPIKNRSLWMSTANTNEKGTFWVSLHTLYLIQGGYAPTDFLHFNITTTLPVWNFGFFGVGGKAQIYKSPDFVQALSIGVDWLTSARVFHSGSTNDGIHCGNITISLGAHDIKVHINYTQFFPSEYEYSNSPNWIQVGFETQLAKKPNSGLKFIAEGIISPTDNHKRDLSLLLFGFRTYQKKFSAELALMATRFVFFEYSEKFRLITLPYLSFTYKF